MSKTSIACSGPSAQPSTAQVEALAATMAALSLPGELRARILRMLNGSADHAEKLLTTRQAAAILEHHPKHLLRLGRAGILHPVRRSKRCLRWKESEVQAFARGGIAA